MDNEAVLVGFELLLTHTEPEKSAVLMFGMTDTANKDLQELFKPEDWLVVNAAMNTVRREMHKIISKVNREIDAVNRYG